ncbi:MAG: hypothetical protein ACE5I5_17280, partial [Candidatus Heimdallarchaeota archaeon]
RALATTSHPRASKDKKEMALTGARPFVMAGPGDLNLRLMEISPDVGHLRSDFFHSRLCDLVPINA